MTRKVVSPIALDKSINTTEQTPRNIADVLAQQLAAIKTAIESGNGNLEAAFVCYYGVTTATQIKEAIEDGKVPYFYYNGSVAQLWKVETDKYTFRTTNTRSVEGQTILDVVDYVVNGSVWSTVTREVSGGSSSGQSYIASVNSLADFDTTGKSGMQDLVSVANVPADGVYQVSVMLHITPKTASATKSDLVLQFTSSDNTGWPSHTFHAVVDDSQTFAQQLSFSTSVSLKAGQNTLRIQCGGLNTEYLVFVDELTLAQLVNGVYHNGDDFDDVHTLPEAADFNNDDGVLVDGATGGPRFMLWRTLANKVLGFIKSLSTTITAFRSGDVIPVDGPSGTAKMPKDDLLNETAENALKGNIAQEFVDNTPYTRGEYVTHDGKLYVMTEDYSGVWNQYRVKQIPILDKSVIVNDVVLVNKNDAYDWQEGICSDPKGSIATDNRFNYNGTLIPVYPNVTYKIGHRERGEYIYFYDSNGFFVGSYNGWSGASVNSAEFTTPDNCAYIRYSFLISSITSSVLSWYDGLSTKKGRSASAALLGKVDFDSTMFITDKIIASKNYSYDWQEGLCQSANGAITADSRFNYNGTLIPVYPNVTYKIGHRERGEYIYFYDEEENFIGSYNGWSDAAVNNAEFTTPKGCKYVRYSYVLTASNGSDLTWIKGFSSTRVEEVAESIPQKNTLSLKTCTTLYERSASAGLKCETRIYPENFVHPVIDLKLDAGRFASVTGRPITDGKISVVASCEDYADKEVKIPIVATSLSDQRITKEFVLCIGESTTAAYEKDPLYGAVHDEWGYPSAIQSFNIKDNADELGKTIKTIGTKNNRNITITYKGNTYTNRAFDEGYAGWPSYAFANWPCMAKLTGSATRFGDSQMWYALGLASKTPYSQASYNNDREEYTATATQRDTITKTKFGYYKVDGSAGLWQLCQTLSGQSGYPVFADIVSDYDGSASQVQMIQDWCDALASDPINPFYDVTLARDSVHDTAFSIDTYLSRYRTMDDVGVRLSGSAGQSVIGSDGENYTIGTKVSDVNAYDVCTPTIVIFNVGINDIEKTPGASTIVDAIKALLSSTTIPCGWFVTRHPGATLPSLWADNVQKYKVISQHLENAQEALVSWFDSEADKTFLPCAFVQPPNSVTADFESIAFDCTNKVINASLDNLHPGINAYRAIGWMLVNWIYSL